MHPVGASVSDMLQLVVSCDEDICESQRQTNAPSDRTAKRFRPSAQGCRSAAATLGIEFESVSTPMGLRLPSTDHDVLISMLIH